jgi:hypothetical protein
MVAHTNGGNSIPRKDRWTLAISILALLMSVAAFWESHRSIELEVAKKPGVLWRSCRRF